MGKLYVFAATGLEEVECLATVDIARRGGIDVEIISVTGEKDVTGAHNITFKADKLFEEADFSDADFLFLPGGLPGVANLAAHEGLCELLKGAAEKGERIGAICAAPAALGRLGILKGKRATCYPGFEKKMEGATAVPDGVITDGNITTGRGPGLSIDMGLEIVGILKGRETADQVKEAIQHPDTI